jgi:hypothetical protein
VRREETHQVVGAPDGVPHPRQRGSERVTSQHVGQPRGKVEGVLCIAFEITGFFRAFNSKT